jgi:hypothetical protein
LLRPPPSFDSPLHDCQTFLNLTLLQGLEQQSGKIPDAIGYAGVEGTAPHLIDRLTEQAHDVRSRCEFALRCRG